MTLLDIILTIFTGGFWLIVVLIRNGNHGGRSNKEQYKYYKRMNKRRWR